MSPFNMILLSFYAHHFMIVPSWCGTEKYLVVRITVIVKEGHIKFIHLLRFRRRGTDLLFNMGPHFQVFSVFFVVAASVPVSSGRFAHLLMLLTRLFVLHGIHVLFELLLVYRWGHWHGQTWQGRILIA